MKEKKRKRKKRKKRKKKEKKKNNVLKTAIFYLLLSNDEAKTAGMSDLLNSIHDHPVRFPANILFVTEPP